MLKSPPKAGVYPGMSFEEYLSIPYPSSSSIKIGHNVSMRHMRACIDGVLEDKDTHARRFGRALHAKILEPQRFAKEFLIAAPCCGLIGSGDRKGQECGKASKRQNPETGKWYCKTHGKGLEDATGIISEGDLAEINGAGKSLESNPIVSSLRQVGFAEYTVIAEVEGVLVKARYDYYSMSYRGQRLIVDIKKFASMKGSEEELQTAIRNYEYDLQAALYREVHRQHFGSDALFMWLFVEDKTPHEVVPKFLSSPGERIGTAKYGSTLRRWSECVEWDQYPGYGSEPAEIFPADWEMKKYGVN